MQQPAGGLMSMPMATQMPTPSTRPVMRNNDSGSTTIGSCTPTDTRWKSHVWSQPDWLDRLKAMLRQESHHPTSKMTQWIEDRDAAVERNGCAHHVGSNYRVDHTSPNLRDSGNSHHHHHPNEKKRITSPLHVIEACASLVTDFDVVTIKQLQQPHDSCNCAQHVQNGERSPTQVDGRSQPTDNDDCDGSDSLSWRFSLGSRQDSLESTHQRSSSTPPVSTTSWFFPNRSGGGLFRSKSDGATVPPPSSSKRTTSLQSISASSHGSLSAIGHGSRPGKNLNGSQITAWTDRSSFSSSTIFRKATIAPRRPPATPLSSLFAWRTQMIRWCFHITTIFNWDHEWVYAAFELLDRCMLTDMFDGDEDTSSTTYRTYQLYCMVCFHIISKMNHTSPTSQVLAAPLVGPYGEVRFDAASTNVHANNTPHMLSFDMILHMSHGKYAHEELKRLEYKILSKLQWRLTVPTVPTIYRELLEALDLNGSVCFSRMTATGTSLRQLMDQILCDADLISYPNSLVALALLVHQLAESNDMQTPTSPHGLNTFLNHSSLNPACWNTILRPSILDEEETESYWKIIEILRCLDDLA